MQIAAEHLTPSTTLSPFLPNTSVQFAWSSSSLDLLKTCPRLYQYTMIDGWQSRDESIHLRFGIEYHTALQEYAISKAKGIKHEDAIHDTIRSLHTRVFNWVVDRSPRAGKYKNRESIISLVIDYLDHFADDPAETFILESGEPAVELSFRLEMDWGPQADRRSIIDEIRKLPEGDIGNQVSIPLGQPYLLCGHLDRIVNFSDNLYVMDHKTSMSTLSGYYFNQWSPSNQMTLYTYAGNIILHSSIKGVIISAAQIKLEEPNAFQRGFSYRTPDQLQEWTEDLRFWLGQAEAFATAQYWPQNDTSCGKFGGCKFREVCSKSPQVRDSYLKASFDKIDPIQSANNPFFDRSGE
jgi:hypothetical protein